MKFQVPQFIETETKIIGPFTLRQFLWIAGGAVVIFLLNFLLPPGFFILVSLFVAAIALAFAFYKIEGIPLANYLGRAISYAFGGKRYYFIKDEDRQSYIENGGK